jgi:hypothetical protein
MAKKQPERKKTGIKVEKGIHKEPRRVSVLERGSYSFPTVCSCCLAPAEATFKAHGAVAYGNQIKTVDIKVPICKACKRHIFIWKSFIFLILSSIFAGVFFLIFISRVPGIGILAISAISIFLYRKLISRWKGLHPDHGEPDSVPVSIRPGTAFLTFVFGNPKFAELFAELNGGRAEE